MFETRNFHPISRSPNNRNIILIWKKRSIIFQFEINLVGAVQFRNIVYFHSFQYGVNDLNCLEIDIISHLAGIKVEAVCGTATRILESHLSLATDDKNFGGIWRPLFNH